MCDMSFGLADIEREVGFRFSVVGDSSNCVFKNAKTIQDADEFSIVWVNSRKPESREWLEQTKAKVVVCDESVSLTKDLLKSKVFLLVENPKLFYVRLLTVFFAPKIKFGIHPSAVVDPEAEVEGEVYIGPFTYIGKCKIGKGSVIHGHCYLYDGVEIGSNVTIHAGCRIGSDGFGYARNPDGQAELFPHVGNVIIEDNVDIGANTCVDRGSLGSTYIRKGAKIDNLVHIAHNVEVGRDSFVIANAMIAGSTKIGERSWIAPSTSVINGVRIGDDVVLGMASNVLKSVPSGETWYGSPAKAAVKK